ncbi:MAG: hypothetical protein LBB74_03990 [Chitinispirillales bacterium]|jgi:uncharacterized membrane protein (UPF0127 family)|nr:hypothetical protein [Chitinispirillales bacterium]
MCEISTTLKIQGWPLVMCTYHDGEFMPAKAVVFFDQKGDMSKITKFNIDKTKQCFNNKPVSPVIKVNEDIDARFLQVGNRVEFVM